MDTIDWQSQFEKALEQENMTEEEFFQFLEGKVKRYNLPWDGFPWGCFPQLDQAGRIEDIRILVPTIVDRKTLLVNLHEYVHAYELFQELGTTYIERREEREEKARMAEKRYLIRIENTKMF